MDIWHSRQSDWQSSLSVHLYGSLKTPSISSFLHAILLILLWTAERFFMVTFGPEEWVLICIAVNELQRPFIIDFHPSVVSRAESKPNPNQVDWFFTS